MGSATRRTYEEHRQDEKQHKADIKVALHTTSILHDRYSAPSEEIRTVTLPWGARLEISYVQSPTHVTRELSITARMAVL